MKKTIILIFLTVMGTMLYSAPTYEYKRELREGARGSGQIWENIWTAVKDWKKSL